MSDGQSRQVDRVFAVLGSFDDRHRMLTLSELAARSRLPVATTHRLVRALEAVGALERLPRGQYAIGLRLYEIGSLAGTGLDLLPASLPSLNALSRMTGQHALLAVRDRDHAVLVERVSWPNSVRVRYRVGGRLPFGRTGGGLVLLAFAPAELQQEVLAAFRPDWAVERIHSAADLRGALAEIRMTSLLIARERCRAGLQTVAAPIRDSSGAAIAALSIVLPGDHDARRLAPAVRACSRAITRTALGS